MSDPQFSNTTNPRFPGPWRKSSASGSEGTCLFHSIAADGSGDVAVADSKAGPTADVQVYGPQAWAAFVTGVRTGTLRQV